MKTNKLIAAGIAAAGASAVALTAVAPAALTAAPDAVVPAQSHEIVLTAGFDLGENLEILWEGYKTSSGIYGGYMKDLGEALTSDAVLTGLKKAPLTVLALPTSILYTSAVVDNLSRRAPGGIDAAINTVAGSGPGGQYVKDSVGIRQSLEDVSLTVGGGISLSTTRTLLTLSGKKTNAGGQPIGDLKIQDIPKALADGMKADRNSLRTALFGADKKPNTANGQNIDANGTNGVVGKVRANLDKREANVRSAVDTELNKSSVGKSIKKNVVDPIRKAADDAKYSARDLTRKVREITKRD